MKIAVLLLPLLVHACACARILGINPTPSISHQLPFLIIMRALAERGHHVTIITTDPMKDPPPNTTQVDVSFMYEKWKRDVDFFQLSQLPKFDAANFMGGVAVSDCEAQFQFPAVKELVQYGQKFDVVIMELFLHFCYLGMVQKLGAPPVVGFWSAELYPHLHRIAGNPVNPAYFPEFQSTYTDHMTFWERAHNAYDTLQSFRTPGDFGPRQDETMRKHFGSELHSIHELQYNISLLLANNHYCTGYPKPLQPNVIQMTGLHITGKSNPLPQDIQRFLDGAKQGAIYFSLGSNVKSSSLPGDTLRVLLEAFSQLPQRVLWKFEDDSLPGKPANVMVAKWLPQQDVLAHPNVRLFITQGGLQSFNEAAYYGVPLIGIPFFGDQGYNVAKMVSAGIGMKLDFKSITKEKMLQTIQTVLGDKSYQENMKRYSAIYREHQGTSLENAVWWVEYVIRHQGAPHLRSAALDLHWWQLLLLDVIAFILAVAATVAFVLYKVMRRLVSAVSRPSKIKKQ
ncbi:UDP-glucosyltransferase 2-like isoform X2 [Schistocerca americana]|nr:UDP-glucosyltransferase 2-like isoform X2 [Schistocerca americana]XP_046993669.1 UDP-glucosyltransferase 2-like isoform X2 [Schistocerca americana]XP_046993670.1 UDP-glucosyltransferase 2-like isoform X2 [Schistocerca americana]